MGASFSSFFQRVQLQHRMVPAAGRGRQTGDRRFAPDGPGAVCCRQADGCLWTRRVMVSESRDDTQASVYYGGDAQAERHPLDAFFKPRTVAVVGASEKPGSVGRTVLWNLIASPFGGTVYAVNPNRR